MTFLRLLPVILSGILMAAHFLRAGYTIFMAMVLLGLLILFVKRPWAARLMQFFLVIGTAEWIITLLNDVAERIAVGEDYTRLIFILGGVALFTFASAFVFQGKALRERYGLGRRKTAVAEAAAAD